MRIPLPLKDKFTHLLTILTLLASCHGNDARLAEFASRATEQQARQNDQLAEQSQAVLQQGQTVAATARDLVQQDAAARREMIQAHAQLEQRQQVARDALDQQRKSLADERQAAVEAARREPVMGAAIITAGLALAALLPLVVTAYALQRLPPESPEGHLIRQALLEYAWQVPADGKVNAPPLGTHAAELPRLPGQVSTDMADQQSPTK